MDTPVRGFVYEAAGTVGAEPLANGARSCATARERWRLPAVRSGEPPEDHEAWLAAAPRGRGVAASAVRRTPG